MSEKLGQVVRPSTALKRGRPRTFDRDAVVDQLVRLFRQHGSEDTGQERMRALTGLSGSSLSHAFGDKAAIFDVVLQRYQELTNPWIDGLAEGSQGLEDIERYLDALQAHVTGDGTPAGCLMTSTWVRPIGRLPAVQIHTRAFRDRWRRAFTAALRRASDRGELSASAIEDLAWLQLAVHSGAMIAAVDDPTGVEASSMIRSMRAQISHWRVT